MNVVSCLKSSLAEMNLYEMEFTLSSSLLAMKTFFIAIFVSNRDEKQRSSPISFATVGLKRLVFRHHFIAKLFSDEKIKFSDE